MTQSEIAAEIGVSQMHVSRLLRRAIEQLRILARVPESAPDPDGAQPGATMSGA